MRLKDLRLGNWVAIGPKDRPSFPMQVTGLFESDSYQVQLNFDGNEGDVWEESIEDLVCVPITDELLDSCLDMVKPGRHVFIQSGRQITILANIGNAYSVMVGKSYIAEVQYVHELQNLFSVLGKELDVKF
jgi:hypothetical protein